MGGFLGIGGSGYKTDRHEQLKSYGQLNNVFYYGMNQGKANESAGTNLLGQAGDYYSKLLSGNRPAVLQAVAPVANAANAQEDAQKRQLDATGTARGGGVNAVGQQLETAKNATIDNAINEARGGAAQGATQVGSVDVNAALRLLGLGADVAESKARISSESRAESDKHNQMVQGQVTNAIDALFGAFA